MPKTIKKQLKTYKCPHCKKVQTTILQWQDASICYEMNLKTGDGRQINIEGGDFSNFTCPNCGKDLPASMNPQILAVLGI